MKRVLVTGASGFIGSAVVSRLALESEVEVIAGVRQLPQEAESIPNGYLRLGELGEDPIDPVCLRGISTIVHTAARVHVMRESAENPLSEFRRVNVQGTLSLAEAAAAAGVERFLFLSSIKVNGEVSAVGAPFFADQPAAPKDAYGISKHEAEQGLLLLAERTGMEVVIIRPPLVYGPGVRANFLSMMIWLHKGLPLPLGGIDNRRSLVALDNLVDLLVCCIGHPAAANQIFLVSDGEDISTTELTRRLAHVMGKTCWGGWGVKRYFSVYMDLCKWILVRRMSCWGGSHLFPMRQRCVRPLKIFCGGAKVDVWLWTVSCGCDVSGLVDNRWSTVLCHSKKCYG
jgi:nucleoside-diphosphate-sugar epimerase